MKKFLTFAIVCCLVFLSSSTVFATATQWDTSDQLNLKGIATTLGIGGNIYSTINNIYSRLNIINNNLVDIKGYLVHGSSTVADLIYNIQTWMSPIYNAVVESPIELRTIKGLLGYPSTDSDTGVTTWNSYLGNLNYQMVERIYDYWVPTIGANGTVDHWDNEKFPFTFSMFRLLQAINNAIASEYVFGYQYTATGYNTTQSSVNWSDLSTQSFTPTSITNGIYTWLSKIQAPVARLSYVLASDERIKAQEAAAANEDAVVDNFIDSSGSGASSPSDISSISSLSSGFKNNISTDANVSGIWNIFNSDNFGWFSQETADQLDTSGSGTRTLRSSSSYPTPLLDKQTEDILKYLGGDNND